MASRLNESGGGFSVESLRLPLAALGIFGLLAGLGAWLVQGEFGLLPRILIAAGVLLLGIYVALDPEDVWAKITGRGALDSGNAVPSPSPALVILGLFNVLGSRYQTKFDLTANKQFTLSDQSIKVAQSLPAAGQGHGLADGERLAQAGLPDAAQRLSESLGRQDHATSSSIPKPARATPWPRASRPPAPSSTRWATRSRPAPARPRRTSAPPWSSSNAREEGVLHDRPRRALAGRVRPAGLRHDQAGPERDNFTTAPLNLLTARAVPDDAAELVIAGPTNPFLAEEKTR